MFDCPANNRNGDCMHCGGTGLCEACKGEKNLDGRECQRCGGSGKCKHCGGSGKCGHRQKKSPWADTREDPPARAGWLEGFEGAEKEI